LSQPIRAVLQQAVALHQAGRLAEAKSLYEQILTAQPGQFDSLHFLGVIALQTGDTATGVRLIGEAIAINPKAAAAHFNLGNALRALGRPDEAVASYDRALALRPDAETHFNRANALKELRRLDEALAGYDRALALDPDGAAAWYNRGNALKELGRPEEALVSYDRALFLRADYPDAHNNRGNALRDLKRMEEALASYDRALSLRPDDAETHNNRGNALKELRRLDEAIASYDRAIALQPDHADSHWNKSVALLLKGDFARGWDLYEWRWKSGKTQKFMRNFPQPLWLGDFPLEGRTILLHAEQGLGDSIQFCRYAPLVRERGAKKVLLMVPRPLLRLLDGLDGVSELVEKREPWPTGFDCHCPLLSLPLAFGTRLETIPGSAPYLKADPQRVAAWQATLGPRTKPRVGIVWSSTSLFESDATRSMEFSRFIQGIPPGRFDVVCLQKEIKARDREDVRAQGEVRFFGERLTDFAETAALASCMDVVVSTCTSVPHLTAALGIPTWILLAHVPDWRWLLDRDDSPWYDAATLYRQGDDRRWETVLERVAADLLKLGAAG